MGSAWYYVRCVYCDGGVCEAARLAVIVCTDNGVVRCVW